MSVDLDLWVLWVLVEISEVFFFSSFLCIRVHNLNMKWDSGCLCGLLIPVSVFAGT